MSKNKVVEICDKIILCALYAIAFFFPISKAIIEILSTLAIACLVVKKICQGRFLPRTSINFAIFAYLTICFLSLFISTNFKISARTLAGKTIQEILFFFVIVDALNSERRIKWFLAILFLSSALLGIDGVYQYFSEKDFIRHRPVIFTERIYATFPTPNDFGCYLISIIPFVITCFFAKFRFKLSKPLCAGLSTLLFICLILTVSRGAWFAFLASILFMGFWIYQIRTLLLFLGFFMILTQSFYPVLIKERLGSFFANFDVASLNDAGSLERKIVWLAGWKMFMSSPLRGVGLGTFMFNFKRFILETYQYGPLYAHNCYLQMAAEIGTVGLVSFLAVLVLFFYNGIKMINAGGKTFFWHILLASLAAIAAYAVQMAVDTIFYSLDLGMLFWIVLGLGAAAMKCMQGEEKAGYIAKFA